MFRNIMRDNPSAILPDIITTKTHSVLPDQYISGAKKSVITRSAGYDHFEHLVDTVEYRVTSGILRQCGCPDRHEIPVRRGG